MNIRNNTAPTRRWGNKTHNKQAANEGERVINSCLIRHLSHVRSQDTPAWTICQLIDFFEWRDLEIGLVNDTALNPGEKRELLTI